MFNLQGSEIVFILLIALVVLGPEKLPDAVRRFTKTYAELKKMGSGFQSELKSALDEPMKQMQETATLIQNAADPAAFDASGDEPAADEQPAATDELEADEQPAATDELAADEQGEADEQPAATDEPEADEQPDAPDARHVNNVAAANSSAAITQRSAQPNQTVDGEHSGSGGEQAPGRADESSPEQVTAHEVGEGAAHA